MPTTAVISEPMRAAEYLVSELPSYQSREVAVIGGGADLYAGTVLGKITASGIMVPVAPAAIDGSQNAAAILYSLAPASAGNISRTITARGAEVNGLLLTWPAGMTQAQQAAAIVQLAALGILVRT